MSDPGGVLTHRLRTTGKVFFSLNLFATESQTEIRLLGCITSWHGSGVSGLMLKVKRVPFAARQGCSVRSKVQMSFQLQLQSAPDTREQLDFIRP